jgi:TLC domain
LRVRGGCGAGERKEGSVRAVVGRKGAGYGGRGGAQKVAKGTGGVVVAEASGGASPRQRRKAYTAMPAVEWVLGLLTVFFVGASAWVMWNASWADLYTWLACLAGTEVVVYLTRRFWKMFGSALSDGAYQLGMVASPPLGSPSSMAKWLEQSWQLTVHTFFALCGYYLIFVAERHEGLPAMWEFDELENLWLPRPWYPGGQPMDWRVRLLYTAELAVWIYTAGMHVFFDKRRKDFQAMLGHHVVTIYLISGSFYFNLTRIGLLVLFVNDITDVFVDWLKMANYLKLRGPKALYLAEASFFVLVIAFAYFRVWHHPIRINLVGGSVWTRCNAAVDVDCGPWAQQVPLIPRIAVTVLVGGLWALTVLHSYWFFLMLRIIWTILTKDAETASREEYEGDSDDEDANDEECYLFVTTLRRAFFPRAKPAKRD